MRHPSLFKLITVSIMGALLVGTSAALPAVTAQDAVFPLPAPLYMLDSAHTLLRIDPATGEQVAISSSTQPVADFAIAPDGEWYAYRTLDSVLVISDFTTGSGYVLQFDVPAPSRSTAQTISWSPDAARLAYIVSGGLRIANLGAGEYGESQFSDVSGAWTTFYWQDVRTVIARDEQGNTTRLSLDANGAWFAEAAPGLPASVTPVIPSYLTPEGVVFNNSTLIPGTAGILTYAWGPLPPPVAETLDLPADLFYLMADEHGLMQLWQVSSGAAPVQWTTEPAGVIAYALSPVNTQIAYATPTQLVITDITGDPAAARTVATIETKNRGAGISWSPEGSQIAYHDTVGVWVVPASGAYAARLVRAHEVPDANSTEMMNVQVFMNPRWSPDGSQLLVTIGLWEGSQQGLLNTATGELTPLNALNIGRAQWTRAGQIVGWSSSLGYESPGLFLIDPVAPDSRAVDLVDPGTPVLDMTQTLEGSVYIVRANSAEMGPDFVRLQSTDLIGGAFAPEFADAPGGYVSLPQLYAAETSAGTATFVAGLRNMIYDEQGFALGDLVILDLGRAPGGAIVTPVQLHTPGPVSNVQWGR
ncbi:MAG: hypothetical protein JXA10_15380 [Anaerolineae bacterium]|nr:hypothetical protein [Anaerolineae bacterium]